MRVLMILTNKTVSAPLVVRVILYHTLYIVPRTEGNALTATVYIW